MRMETEGRKIRLSGRIDSNNASQVEKEMLAQLDGWKGTALILDAAELDYISSAGLRVLLRLKKTFPADRNDQYEILIPRKKEGSSDVKITVRYLNISKQLQAVIHGIFDMDVLRNIFIAVGDRNSWSQTKQDSCQQGRKQLFHR